MARRGTTGWLVLLVVLAVVAGVGVAFWRGQVRLPGQDGCTATASGRSVNLDAEQSENATLIAAIGVRRELPARAVSIALATAYQESKIRNLDHGDRDSLGLFQQRPSQGWGSAQQVRNPYYAINAFYDVLAKVSDYKTLRITEAAQRVQRSAYPEAYQDHAPDARALASVLTGYSQGGRFTCTLDEPSDPGSGQAVIRSVKRAYGPSLRAARTGVRQDVAIRVSGESGRRLGWSVGQYAVAHSTRLGIRSVSYDGKVWRTGQDSKDGWTKGGQGTTTKVVISLG